GGAIGKASDGNPIPKTVPQSKLKSASPRFPPASSSRPSGGLNALSANLHIPQVEAIRSLFVRQVLCDLVVARGAGDRDRDHCASVFLLEKNSKRLEQHRLEPRRHMGDIGLHFEIADQVS